MNITNLKGNVIEKDLVKDLIESKQKEVAAIDSQLSEIEKKKQDLKSQLKAKPNSVIKKSITDLSKEIKKREAELKKKRSEVDDSPVRNQFGSIGYSDMKNYGRVGHESETKYIQQQLEELTKKKTIDESCSSKKENAKKILNSAPVKEEIQKKVNSTKNQINLDELEELTKK